MKSQHFFQPKKFHLLLAATLSSLSFTAESFAEENYAEALQKSIYFYDVQRSGKLDNISRVPWRGDSTLNDGKEVGADLSGGFYDAGDNIKFGLPMAATATMLAWGVLDFYDGYEKTQQLPYILSNLKWFNDYFLNTVVIKGNQVDRIYGQVTDARWSHSNAWMPYEVLDQFFSDAGRTRDSYYITAQHPGSDLAGSTAAAMTAASMVFSDARIKNLPSVQALFSGTNTTPDQYAATLLSTAKKVFEFAEQNKGLYHDNLGRYSDANNSNSSWEHYDPSSWYKSWSGYEDELAFSAAWLARAENSNPDYLNKAKQYIDSKLYTSSTQSWDEKQVGTYLLLARLLGDDVQNNADSKAYHHAMKRYLNKWTSPCDESAFTVQIKQAYQEKYNTDIETSGSQTCVGGLAWNSGISRWGSTRYAGNTAFMALLYADLLKDSEQQLNNDLASVYFNFAKSQVDFILGKNTADNGRAISFLIGYGDNYPKQPHHATAQGAWNGLNSGPGGIGDPNDNRHILYGALAGGPTNSNGGGYQDDRGDYIANEVAIDYNSGITGALAGLNAALYPNNGRILNDFPVLESVADDEYFAGAYLLSTPKDLGDFRVVEIQAQLYNHSAWPARVTYDQSMRFYFTLRSGQDVNDVRVTINYDKGISLRGIKSAGNNLYYMDFGTNDPMYPGGINNLGSQDAPSLREVQFKISVPKSWQHDFQQDWSLQQLPDSNTGVDSKNLPAIQRIPVYGRFSRSESIKQLGGQAPDSAVGSIIVTASNAPNSNNALRADVYVDGSIALRDCAIAQGCDLSQIAAGEHEVSLSSVVINQDNPRQDLLYQFSPLAVDVVKNQQSALNFSFNNPQITHYYTTQVSYSIAGANIQDHELSIGFTQNGQTQFCVLPAFQLNTTCDIETVQADGSAAQVFQIEHPQLLGFDFNAAASSSQLSIDQGNASVQQVFAQYDSIPTYQANLRLHVSGANTNLTTTVVFHDEQQNITVAVSDVKLNASALLVENLPEGIYTVSTDALQINGTTFQAESLNNIIVNSSNTLANVDLYYEAQTVSSANCQVSFSPVYSFWQNGDGTFATTLQMQISSDESYQAGEWSLSFVPSGNDSDGKNPHYVQVLGSWGWSAQVSNGEVIGAGTEPSWQNFGPDRSLYFGMNITSQNQNFLPKKVLLNGMSECSVIYQG